MDFSDLILRRWVASSRFFFVFFENLCLYFGASLTLSVNIPLGLKL